MNLIKLITAIQLLLLTGATTAMATEEAPYTVIKTDDIFELREYAPQVLAEIIVDGDLEGAGNKAFRPLFRYISGDNKSRGKISSDGFLFRRNRRKRKFHDHSGQPTECTGKVGCKLYDAGFIHHGNPVDSR